MKPAALEGLLGQLQAATADKEGTLKVVETVNRLLDDTSRLPPDRLRHAFERWWPDLAQKLAEARQIVPNLESPPQRTADSKLDEVIEIVRAIQRNAAPTLSRGGSLAHRQAWATVRSDLRNLVTAEESYFADNVKYTSNLSDLKYAPSPGVVIRNLTLTADGWYAMAQHAETGVQFGIYIGTSQDFAPFREGEPFPINS